ncbi:MAG: SapC family protein [Mangrovicoccus sp.]|nr:SapC family protein [Mangrovicoccus sp.]
MAAAKSPQKTALIYDRITPVSPERYGKHSIELGKDFRFAAGLDAVPALGEEFAALSRFCPVVFAGPEDAPLPHAMLGVKRGQNLFIGPNGGWAGPYIPAFLRRYPFISAPSRKTGGMILCVDDAFAGLNKNGRGQALYNRDGSPSKLLSDVAKFIGNFDASLAATQSFVKRLQAFDLLEPMSIRIRDGEGDVTGEIGGMYGVAPARLEALSDEARGELEATGDVQRCKLHIQSLKHLERKAPKRPVAAKQ